MSVEHMDRAGPDRGEDVRHGPTEKGPGDPKARPKVRADAKDKLLESRTGKRHARPTITSLGGCQGLPSGVQAGGPLRPTRYSLKPTQTVGHHDRYEFSDQA